MQNTGINGLTNPNKKLQVPQNGKRRIVNKKSYFHKYSDTTNETVKVANGETVKIKGQGDILWKTTDINGKVITVKIKNVKLIPTMTENLLSLSSIFTQYKNATEIERKNDDLILKIRNNKVG